MIGRLWRENRWLVLAFVALLGLAVYFGIGAIRHARDFGVAKEQPIAAWMTPRYVAHSWDLPREVMVEIFQVEPPGPGRVTLAEIAEDRGIPVADLIAEIEVGIAAFRADRGE